MARKKKTDAGDESDEVVVGRKKLRETRVDTTPTVSVPNDQWRVDPDTGELCIGNECFEARIGKGGEVAMEVYPESPTCDPRAKERLERLLLNAADGKGRVKFKRRARKDT
mgnify:CR=1 FL=1